MSEKESGTEGDKQLEDNLSMSVLVRHYAQQGRSLEDLRSAVAWLPHKDEHVYNVFIRYPRKRTDDTLLIAKAVSWDRPLISFHGGDGLVGTLTSFGRRYKAGKLDWREDHSPPDAYAEYAEFIEAEVAYMREHGIGL